MEKSANEVTDLSLNMAGKSWAYFLKRLNHGKFRPKKGASLRLPVYNIYIKRIPSRPVELYEWMGKGIPQGLQWYAWKAKGSELGEEPSPCPRFA